MEIGPFWYSEKYIYTARVPLDLIFKHRVMNKVDAAYLSLHYGNLLIKSDELVIERLK
tara:strand:- start:232 stop:405 length:174 start_codon:yes stop_codon:yes gene_type:complete